jgi:hypothetical protein
LEDLAVDGRIILNWVLKKWHGSMDWIDLAQNMDNWLAVVNAVTNFRFPQNAQNSLDSFSGRTLLHVVS